MFNVSKKTVSLVLCLTLIASVVVFCLAGPASAVQNTIKYPVYDEAVSLAAKPTVNLIFEGDNYGGIPIGRHTTGVEYVDGYAKVTATTGWVFFGKDGSVGKNTVKHDTDAAKTAVNDLFKLEVDHTYLITMKYKKLAGATVATTSLNYGITADPTAVAAQNSDAYIKDVVTSGLTVVWNVDGVAQESGSVLEKDTDWQTVSVKLTAVQSGAFGFQPNGRGYYAFDDFKIYDSTALGNSFQNPISFDNGGIVSTRAMNLEASYHKDGYAIIPDNGNCAGAAFIGIDNAYNTNIAQNKSNIAEADSLYHSKMFKFLPGNSYKITFKYRYAAGSYVVNGAIPRLKLQKAPNGAAHANDDLWFKDGIPGNCFAKDVFVTGLECVTENTNKTTAIAEDTPWQDVTVTFTVRNDIEGFTGAYFGIGVGLSDGDHGMVGVTANRTLHIDDYNVEELVGYQLSSFNSQDVSIDFDNTMPTDVTRKNATVTYGTDEKTGSKYMKVTAEGNARISMAETRVLKMNKKYYISFDAKSEDGCTNFNLIMGDKVSNYRIFLTDTDPKKALNSSGSKFYINGKEVSGYDSFVPSSEWRHYGFTLNLDYEKWNQIQSSGHIVNDTNNWQKLEAGGGVYLLFGAGIDQSGTSICYDNIKISQFDEIPNAVPDEGEIKDNTQVSKRNPSGTGENYISAGLRFKNCLPNDVVAAADEVGFVVIPSSMAVSAPNSWYDLEGNGHTDAKKVVCKDNSNSTNRYYEKTGFDTYYQLVLTGLSTETGNTAYNRRFSAVMYVKNADGTYQYFALGETSYNQVGAIKDVINAQ